VPVVHRFGPYVFFFYSGENRESFEAPHIHVRSSDGRAVFWLRPVSLRGASGYNPARIERVRRLVVANHGLLLRRWDEYFDDGA
jgi:hypothetical protein